MPQTLPYAYLWQGQTSRVGLRSMLIELVQCVPCSHICVIARNEPRAADTFQRGPHEGAVLNEPEMSQLKRNAALGVSLAVIAHPLLPVLGRQVTTVLRMVWNGRAPVRRRAVSTTVRTSASPMAAHMAR